MSKEPKPGFWNAILYLLTFSFLGAEKITTITYHDVCVSCGDMMIVGKEGIAACNSCSHKDYSCMCGSKQTQVGNSGLHIERAGWRKIDGRWCCPSCTGNKSNLWDVFDGEELK